MERAVPIAILAAALLAHPLPAARAAGGEDSKEKKEEKKAEEPFVVGGSAPDDLTLEANGADLGDLLAALGEEVDFEVVMNDTLERPPVEATIRQASPDEVLRRVLRRRNYALLYRSGELSEVFVLSPPRSVAEAQEIQRRRQVEAARAARAETAERARRAAQEARRARLERAARAASAALAVQATRR